MLHARLMYHACCVVVRLPGAADPGQALANMMFPAINCPTYVMMQCERQILEVVDDSSETVHVSYVGLIMMVLAYMPHELLDNVKTAWFTQHPEILDCGSRSTPTTCV